MESLRVLNEIMYVKFQDRAKPQKMQTLVLRALYSVLAVEPDCLVLSSGSVYSCYVILAIYFSFLGLSFSSVK